MAQSATTRNLYSESKLYKAVSKTIWLIAIVLTVSGFSYHACQLLSQFFLQKSLINIEYFDNSSSGIRLPNATICLNLPSNAQLESEKLLMESLFMVKYFDKKIKNRSTYNSFDEFAFALHKRDILLKEIDGITRFFCQEIGLVLTYVEETGSDEILSIFRNNPKLANSFRRLSIYGREFEIKLNATESTLLTSNDGFEKEYCKLVNHLNVDNGVAFNGCSISQSIIEKLKILSFLQQINRIVTNQHYFHITFLVGSFKYPVYSEMENTSVFDLISQIGGIVGVYLGFSDLTVFAASVKLLKLLRKRYLESQRNRMMWKVRDVLLKWRSGTKPVCTYSLENIKNDIESLKMKLEGEIEMLKEKLNEHSICNEFDEETRL